MIFAALTARDSRIPTFSLDGGVILRPSMTRVLCGYGVDASIDDNKPARCDSTNPLSCVPGCGEPPRWCTKAHPHDENTWMTCGTNWAPGGSGVRPWHPSDLSGVGGLLDRFAQDAAPFTGIGKYKGYAEIVVESDTWLDNLPDSVEAIFMVDCDPDEENFRYPPGGKRGTAATCREAQQQAIDMHRKFLMTYGRDAAHFPLLKLRPDNWAVPFLPMYDVNSDVKFVRDAKNMTVAFGGGAQMHA